MGEGMEKRAAVVEGGLVVPQGARFALVASRFNHFIVDRLVDGALDAIVVARLAQKRSVDAIIALGAVIRGSTPHFDYVAAEVTKGIATVSMQTGVPVAFGVLTTDSIEQAIERAGTKAGNKGWEAAVSAIEMVALGAALDRAGL